MPDLDAIRGFLHAHAALDRIGSAETRDRIAAIAVADGEYVLRASDLAALVAEVKLLRAERRQSLAETHELLSRLSRTEAVAEAAQRFRDTARAWELAKGPDDDALHDAMTAAEPALDAALDALNAGGA